MPFRPFKVRCNNCGFVYSNLDKMPIPILNSKLSCQRCGASSFSAVSSDPEQFLPQLLLAGTTGALCGYLVAHWTGALVGFLAGVFFVELE